MILDDTASGTSHCIGLDDIERAALGDRDANLFIELYGESDRARWRSLMAPFRPDPFDGRVLVSGGHGGNGRDYVTRKLRSDVQLRREWERHLAKFDLDGRTVNGNGDRQDLIIAKDTTPPLKHCREDVQLATRFGVTWQACHAVPLATHERAVPTWANSDERVREFVRHRFPGAFRAVGANANPRSEKGQIRQRARVRAAELSAIVYLAFRLLLPFESIANELHAAPDHVLRVANDARAHGDRFFAGERCCRNRRSQCEGVDNVRAKVQRRTTGKM